METLVEHLPRDNQEKKMAMGHSTGARQAERLKKKGEAPTPGSLCSTHVLTVTSTLMMSPSLSTVMSGMPWQITSLTDVHTLRGKPA